MERAEALPAETGARGRDVGAAVGWEIAGVTAVLALAAALRLWALERNGFGHLEYAAAVRSMLGGWRNFVFAAFDPAGFVSVDLPPVALWVQAASARLLGFRGLSLLLPQALAGVASVAVVWHLVRRVFGPWAGGLAGLALAVMPIGAAVDRSNLPESWLVLVLLLAAWSLVRATET